jgi:hypothetical protein
LLTRFCMNVDFSERIELIDSMLLLNLNEIWGLGFCGGLRMGTSGRPLFIQSPQLKHRHREAPDISHHIEGAWGILLLMAYLSGHAIQDG